MDSSFVLVAAWARHMPEQFDSAARMLRRYVAEVGEIDGYDLSTVEGEQVAVAAFKAWTEQRAATRFVFNVQHKPEDTVRLQALSFDLDDLFLKAGALEITSQFYPIDPTELFEPTETTQQ